MLHTNDTIWSTLDSYWCTVDHRLWWGTCQHVKAAQRPANSGGMVTWEVLGLYVLRYTVQLLTVQTTILYMRLYFVQNRVHNSKLVQPHKSVISTDK